MPSLDQLVQEALAGLVQQGGQPTENAIFGATEQDIQGQAGDQARAAMENTFGRGLGTSTISGNLLGEIEKARADALAKARANAVLGSQSAQLSALGQAASVAQQQLNRGQQASQFQQSLDAAKRGQNIAQSNANKQLLAGGLGMGVGALGNLAGRTFGNEIRGGLRSAAGLNDGPVSPMGGREMMLPQGSAPFQVGSIDVPDLASSGAFGFGDFSMPDLAGGGGFDMPSFDAGGDLFSSGLFDLGGLTDLDMGTSLFNSGLFSF
jgi:hypothetical protein